MSENKTGAGGVRVRIVSASEKPIEKADIPLQLNEEEGNAAGGWITPPYDLNGLATLVDESTILPQCVRAYKNNIAGFGIGIRYKDEYAGKDETPEMKAEWSRAQQVIDLLNTEQDTKEVFEDLIEAREVYGCSYLEVIRNMDGEVVQVDFVKDTDSVRKTKPMGELVPYTYFYNGQEVVRRRRFRKYRQTVNGTTVYYKEFGDPRVMDPSTGEYVGDEKSLPFNERANEIMEFSIGTATYGKIRWIGQTLTVDGARRAESLNNNYFVNGRHTPLLIMVKGGTLTDESFKKLQEYMDGVRGEAGQHKFLVVETEASDNRTGFNDENRPDVEVKDLAAILQKDELFGEYLDGARRKAQSAFQLPDLYVGYTTDFNRATAQTAMEVTEKQVFQPERKSLAWAVNNRLLNSYRFKYIEVFFREPDITNPDDLFKILTVCNNAGGLTPNKAKAILYEALGETSEDYEGDWGNTPLQLLLSAYAGAAGAAPGTTAAAGGQEKDEPAPAPEDEGEVADPAADEGQPDGADDLAEQVGGQVKKAEAVGEPDELIAVMKEVRRLLVKMEKGAA